jgi:hypothetical protein
VVLYFAFPDLVAAEGEERVFVFATEGDTSDAASGGDGKDDLPGAVVGADLHAAFRSDELAARLPGETFEHHAGGAIRIVSHDFPGLFGDGVELPIRAEGEAVCVAALPFAAAITSVASDADRMVKDSASFGAIIHF